MEIVRVVIPIILRLNARCLANHAASISVNKAHFESICTFVLESISLEHYTEREPYSCRVTGVPGAPITKLHVGESLNITFPSLSIGKGFDAAVEDFSGGTEDSEIIWT